MSADLTTIPWQLDGTGVRAVIETPRGSRYKYAFERDTQSLQLRFMLARGLSWPYDYGFVPQTRGEDGDPAAGRRHGAPPRRFRAHEERRAQRSSFGLPQTGRPGSRWRPTGTPPSATQQGKTIEISGRYGPAEAHKGRPYCPAIPALKGDLRMRFRLLLTLALLAAASGCGHKSAESTTTSTTSTAATSAPAAGTPATPSGAMSAQGMNGSTTGGAVSTGAGQPQGFDTEAAAQAHCASDQVVWLNIKSHVYHEKGMLYYGHTKQGAYVCRKEADAAGDRDAKNGK